MQIGCSDRNRSEKSRAERENFEQTKEKKGTGGKGAGRRGPKDNWKRQKGIRAARSTRETRLCHALATCRPPQMKLDRLRNPKSIVYPWKWNAVPTSLSLPCCTHWKISLARFVGVILQVLDEDFQTIGDVRGFSNDWRCAQRIKIPCNY